MAAQVTSKAREDGRVSEAYCLPESWPIGGRESDPIPNQRRGWKSHPARFPRLLSYLNPSSHSKSPPAHFPCLHSYPTIDVAAQCSGTTPLGARRIADIRSGA